MIKQGITVMRRETQGGHGLVHEGLRQDASSQLTNTRLLQLDEQNSSWDLPPSFETGGRFPCLGFRTNRHRIEPTSIVVERNDRFGSLSSFFQLVEVPQSRYPVRFFNTDRR